MEMVPAAKTELNLLKNGSLSLLLYFPSFPFSAYIFLLLL